MRQFYSLSAREEKRALRSSRPVGNVQLRTGQGTPHELEEFRGAAAAMWRSSDEGLRRCGAWTARIVPQSWREKAREGFGRALLAGIAGGELSRRYGRERHVGFAIERAVRGADGGEVA